MYKPCILSFQYGNGLLFLTREIGGLLEETPTQLPELFGHGHELRIVLLGTARLDLPAVGEQRFFEVSPDILDRMEMISLKSGMRKDRFDRLGEALGVVREGGSDLEAEVFASLQKLPGILTIFRRRFMGDQDAVMLVLHDHHTMVRAQRVGAINVTLRRWGEGKQLPQPKTAQMTAALAGREYEAATQVAEQLGFTLRSVTLWPDWWPRMPVLDSRITIVVEPLPAAASSP